jgi:signal transduction histidine kinase
MRGQASGGRATVNTGRPAAARRRSRVPIRSFVIRLALGVTAPMLVFAAFVLLRSAHEQQQAIAEMVLDRALNAQADLDRELRALQEPLVVLAVAYDAGRGEADGFQNAAEQLLQEVGLAVTLRGRHATGTPQPLPIADPSVCAGCAQGERTAARADGRLSVSDLTYSLEHAPFVTMDLPLRQSADSTMVLSLEIRPRIARVLEEQHFPPGWFGFVLDRNGVVLASTANGAGLAVGTEQSAFVAQATNAPRAMSGWLPRWQEGPYAATTRLTRVGWTVGVGASHAIAFAPLHRSLTVLATAATASLVVLALLAMVVGRGVARPVAALADYADALGHGRAAAFPFTGLAEVDDVARSLALSSARLREGNARLVRTADALRRHQRRLRALARNLRRALVDRTTLLERLVAIEEAERRRIARDLHDRLGQYLVALSLGLGELERTWSDPVRSDRLAELRRISAEVGQEVHRLAWELRPSALDDLGLHAAAAHYVKTWGDRLGLAVDFVSDLNAQRFGPGSEIALYRILQEAMTNVARHAHATRVSVILGRIGASVRLIVEDDGTGFGAVACSERQPAGFGLSSMRERVALLGGTLQLESTPGKGTTLLCSVPVC